MHSIADIHITLICINCCL